VALPTNRRDPTDCKGGWFYVNAGSINVIAYPEKDRHAGDATITRAQLLAALKLMRKRKQSDRGEKR